MNRNDSDTPTDADAVVYVVDDDEGMRNGLTFLLRSAGLEARGFASAVEFLETAEPGMRGVLLLDVRMPEMTGPELQQELAERNVDIPTIFITGYGDVPTAVRTMQAGAADFIEKPFEASALLERVHKALSTEQKTHADRERQAVVEQRIERLTPRQRQIMEMVVSGLLNKQIAYELDISIKTVENHRAAIMDRMQAESLADLVRMAMTAGVVTG